MKILHTSDWHIGKRLINRERLDEQAEVLDEIVAVCDNEGVELVLIAGDVFDTYTPSAEAEKLFYQKIKRLAGDNRAVVLISGNHDDGVRLSAAAPLSEAQGIYIVGNERRSLSCEDTPRLVHPIESGKGHATFVNGKGERVFLSFLPYPNEARFKEEKSELPYVEQMQKWIAEGESGNVEKLPSVFVGHLFVAGGAVSESEREIDLGGARAIPVDALPSSDYIALGHLHKKQHMGKGHCYYSGSPLQYAFDESADKGVKVFDLTADGVQNLRDVPLTKGRKLIRLQADDVQSALALLQKHPDELVEMKLFLTAPLLASDSQALSANKNLVSLLAEVHTEESLAIESRKGLSGEKLFELFYQTNYGVEPKEELKTLFLQTLAELDEK
ncbi:MAG: exonuclease subunit SbcD [Clostridiales bacterium]|nr:exonuclease subunit SbcD [Clostridiales bacterium]